MAGSQREPRDVPEGAGLEAETREGGIVRASLRSPKGAAERATMATFLHSGTKPAREYTPSSACPVPQDDVRDGGHLPR